MPDRIAMYGGILIQSHPLKVQKAVGSGQEEVLRVGGVGQASGAWLGTAFRTISKAPIFSVESSLEYMWE